MSYNSEVNPYTGKLQLVFEGALVSIEDSVDTYNNLPITGNTENNLRITEDTDRMYTWGISASDGSLSDWKDVGSATTVDWSAITNKPNSSVEDIDLAVDHKDVTTANPHDVKTSEITGLQTALDGKLDYVESQIGESLAFTSDQAITINDNNDFDFGTGSFTIECWVKFDSLNSGMNYIYSHNDGTNYVIAGFNNSTNRWEVQWRGSGATAVFYSTTGAPTLGQWYHFAVSREPTWIRLLVDGIMRHSGSISGAYQDILPPDSNLSIANNLSGKIYNHRVSNMRRYNASFTPETDVYTRDANTVLLIHGDAVVKDIDGDKVVSAFDGSYDTSDAPILTDAVVIVDKDGNPTATVSKEQLDKSISHKDETDNPHNVDASDVGLDNVDNTSDVNKPISTATQTALDIKIGILDSTPDTDLTANGVKTNFVAGENVTFGDVCYVKSDGKLWKANASVEATSGVIAVATATIVADASGEFLVLGFIRDDSWSWTVGNDIYLDTTSGAMSQTAPSTSLNMIQIVGKAISADIILFNPNSVQIEVA